MAILLYLFKHHAYPVQIIRHWHDILFHGVDAYGLYISIPKNKREKPSRIRRQEKTVHTLYSDHYGIQYMPAGNVQHAFSTLHVGYHHSLLAVYDHLFHSKFQMENQHTHVGLRIAYKQFACL